MAEKVGKKTGEKTKAGRDVYLTPDGERVSEKSVTIKFGENAFVNVPSIHDGIRYTEDEIREMLLEGKIKPTSRHDTMEEAIRAAENRSDKLMNKGGMAQQMDLFNEGGLLDEGGTKDPVSGNDVPVGSLQEEVRDDVPAMLSEGEFVMPADVVRYHGLDKMMALRDEAKLGLARSEAMGQMGNAEEAILPDDVPFGLEDLDIAEEPMEMQVGGFVPQQQPFGVVQQPGFSAQNMFSIPSQFQQPPQIVVPFSQQPFAPPAPVTPVFGPGQPTGQPKETFTFSELMPTVGGTSETREYRNADGESLFIPFINGEPIYPIPEGYFPYTPETTTPDTEDTQVTAEPAAAQQESDAPTREERIAEKERNDRIRARKAAAKELGYTKEANAFAGAFKALLPGGMLLGGAEEAGTIMPDGSIADGAGNTFDPITGEQLGGKGFLNLGKEDFPTPESARAFGVTPASQAGLMSLESEKSLDEFRTPTAVTPETTKVETTLDVTAQPGTTAGDIAQAQVEDRMSAMTEAMNNLGLTGNQRTDFLNAVLSQKTVSIPFATPQGQTTVDFTPRAEAGAAGAEMTAAQNLLDAMADTDAGLSSTALAAQTAADDLLATTVDPTSDLLAGEPGAEIGSASYRQQRDIENKISAAKTADPSQYAKDVRAGVYDSEFDALDKARAEVRLEQNSQDNKVGTNIRDEYGDEVASKVRDDQGTVGSIDTDTGDIYYDSSHDWSQPTQTNVQDDPPAKAQEESESRDDAKIVCTEMYRQTQLADWKEAIKIWGVHQKKYLTPYHEKGYHWLFKPWVRGMRKSAILTFIGAYLAKARTQHLKHVLTHGKAKDSIVGNIWCKIVHPLTYLTGRMLSWQKK